MAPHAQFNSQEFDVTQYRRALSRPYAFDAPSWKAGLNHD